MNLDIAMLSDIYRCRVCGLLRDEPPWGKDGTTASFDICECCGVEFGYEDSTRESVLKYRAAWLASGAKWADPDEKPPGWSLDIQLQTIPETWR